jgi:hypothetical protein
MQLVTKLMYQAEANAERAIPKPTVTKQPKEGAKKPAGAKRKKPSAGYKTAIQLRNDRIVVENRKQAKRHRYKCARDGRRWRKHWITRAPIEQLDILDRFNSMLRIHENTAADLKWVKRQADMDGDRRAFNEADKAFTQHNKRHDRFIFVMNFMQEGRDGLCADHEWCYEEYKKIKKAGLPEFKEIEDAATSADDRIET